MELPERTIDTHVHLKAWDALARKHVEESGVAQFWVLSCGDKITEVAGDEVVLQAAHDMPGRMIPFLCIDWDEWAEEPSMVDRAYDKGAVGLKAICPPKPYDDPFYLPIYERANALHMPVLFHTGIIARDEYDSTQLGKTCYGPTTMQPAHLGGIACAFPELQVLGGHMGYPYLDQTEHNLFYYSNVVHDCCGYMPFEWMMQHMADSVCGWKHENETIRFFYEKILLATDCLLGDERFRGYAEQRRMFWMYFFAEVGPMYAWGEHRDKIFFENAERIMNDILKKQSR